MSCDERKVLVILILDCFLEIVIKIYFDKFICREVWYWDFEN